MSSNRIIVLFGLPGAGKTYAGKMLEEQFGFHFYDGDIDLPDEMREAIRTQAVISNDMRDHFFKRVITSAVNLHEKYGRLVVAQTFIKEQYRKFLLEALPEATFILIQAAERIRESRLTKRTDYPLDLAYAKAMEKNFDEPHIHHAVLTNNVDGKEHLIKQLQLLL